MLYEFIRKIIKMTSNKGNKKKKNNEIQVFRTRYATQHRVHYEYYGGEDKWKERTTKRHESRKYEEAITELYTKQWKDKREKEKQRLRRHKSQDNKKKKNYNFKHITYLCIIIYNIII